VENSGEYRQQSVHHDVRITVTDVEGIEPRYMFLGWVDDDDVRDAVFRYGALDDVVDELSLGIDYDYRASGMDVGANQMQHRRGLS
jgi:hypothetical protein